MLYFFICLFFFTSILFIGTLSKVGKFFLNLKNFEGSKPEPKNSYQGYFNSEFPDAAYYTKKVQGRL
jgi:hypothetical protein